MAEPAWVWIKRPILVSKGLVLALLKHGYTFFVLSLRMDPSWALIKIPPESFLDPHLLIYR